MSVDTIMIMVGLAQMATLIIIHKNSYTALDLELIFNLLIGLQLKLVSASHSTKIIIVLPQDFTSA